MAAALLRGDAGAPDVGGDRGRGAPSQAEGRHALPAGKPGAGLRAPVCCGQGPSLPAGGLRAPGPRPGRARHWIARAGPTSSGRKREGPGDRSRRSSGTPPQTTAARRWRWRGATRQAPACPGPPAKLASTAGEARRTLPSGRVSGQRLHERDQRDNRGHGGGHLRAQADRLALLKLTDGRFEASLRMCRETRAVRRSTVPYPP